MRVAVCSMAALFISMTFLGTSNSSGVQPIVAIERPVFYRERAAGMQDCRYCWHCRYGSGTAGMQQASTGTHKHPPCQSAAECVG